MTCMNFVLLIVALLGGFFSSLSVGAASIVVTPSDYRVKIPTAKPGDEILLRGGGPYIISTNDFTIPSGTASARIVFKKYPGENPAIRNVGLAKPVSYLWFDGLLIDAKKAWGEAVYLSTAHHIRFSNGEVTGGQVQGVLLPHPGADYNEFLNLDVHHNGSRAHLDHGYYIASSYNLVEGGSTHHNAARGLQIYNGYGERANGNVVRRLKCYANSQLGSGAGLSVAAGDDNIVEECDAQSQIGPAIEVAFRNPRNTKIRRNTANTMMIDSDAVNTAVEYNCIDPAKITNKGQNTTGLSTNSLSACSGSAPTSPRSLTIAEEEELAAPVQQASYVPGNPPPQPVSTDPETENGGGFPLWLVGLGVVLVLPVVFSAR